VKHKGAPSPHLGVQRALDEAKFGPERTLNLRESRPTVDAAVTRAEKWLRQRQVDRAGEVLIITGRGKGSEGGVPLIRQGVIRLLHQLRRQGVTAGFREHTSGSLVVEMAPVRTLFESPRRSGGRGPVTRPMEPGLLNGLDLETETLLRQLAQQSLEDLGVHDTEAFVRDEMLRQFSIIRRSMGRVADAERMRDLIRSALRD